MNLKADKDQGSDYGEPPSFTILVVDDDEGLATLICKILQREGFNIECVSNGVDAIAWAVNHPHPFVLLDYSLSDMTGEEVIKTLAEKECEVPFIIMTGYGDEKISVEMMKLGALDYLVKDADFLELMAQVVNRAVKRIADEKKLAAAEKELKESEAKYRDLVETSQDLIWRTDLEARYTYLNPAWEQTLGYKLDEMLGRRFTEFQRVETAQRDMMSFHGLTGGDSLKGYETLFISKSGQEIHLVFNSLPLYDDSGRTVGLQGTAHDITARKRFEDSLQQKEREAVLLAEASRIFNSTLEYQKIFEDLARLVSENVGDTCSIFKTTGGEYLSLITGYRKGEKDKKRYEIMTDKPAPVEGSVVGFCVTNKEPVLIADTSSDQRIDPYYTDIFNIRSYICAPLIAQDKVLGILSTSIDTEGRRFDENDLRLISALADRAAAALVNSDLFDEVKAQAQRLSVVSEISKAVNSRLDIEKVYNIIVEELKKVIPFNFYMNIALYRPQDDTFIFSYLYDPIGKANIKIDHPYPQDSLVLTNTFKTQKIHYIKDGSKDEVPANFKNRIASIKKGYLSFLHLPLIVEQRPIGTLNIAAPIADAFSEDEIKWLEIISSHLANAINNATVHEKLQKSNREMELINGIMDLLNKELDISQVLEEALHRLLDYLGFAAGSIYLLNDAGDELHNITPAPMPQEYLGQVKVLKVADSLNGYVVKTGEPQYGDDFSHHTLVSNQAAQQAKWKSFVIVPIKSKEKILGTIMTATIDEDQTIHEEDVKLLEALGAQMGVALENSNLYKDTVRIAEEWKDTFNSIQDLLSIQGKDYKLIRANKAYADTFSMKPEELIGKTCYEIIHGTEEPCPNCIQKRALEQKKGVAEEIFEPRTGKFFEISASPTFDENGDIVHIIHYAKDITERKRTEEELIRLSIAIDQAAEAIVIADTDATIQYVNPAFERITGYSKEEAIGQNPRILKSGKHDKAFYGDLWDKLTRGETWTGRFTNNKKDGSLYEEEATISPVLDAQGKIVNYVAVKRDVTQEVNLEKQLLQAQKMEAIGTLAGGIAHDFNNILGIINGNAEMALMYGEVPQESPARYYLNQVLKAGNRAIDLVKQILAFSRQSELVKKPLIVEPLVKESLKMLRASLPTTIEFRRRFNASGAAILADPTQIHQVLMNLCTNSYHSMREKGGILEIGTDRVEIDFEAAGQYDITPGQYFKLSVTDTGQGIIPSIIDRIFDPFFTTKEPREGTGMGLSMVHGIVKSHNGGISVNSIPGEGTTFDLFFPIIQVEDDISALENPYLSRSGHERILFVDDEEDLSAIAQTMLTYLGHEVVGKNNSLEALETFRAEPHSFDLVITDLTMPHMTGMQLAEELLRIRSDIPIILCTGYSDLITREEAQALGIKELIMKPLALNILEKAIRSVM